MHMRFLSTDSLISNLYYCKVDLFKQILSLRRFVHTKPHYAWVMPEGHDTGINIYNSLSKSKVPFKTIRPNLVTWYNCGPTVYDSAHIGHALCYVRFDIIRRIFEDIFGMHVILATGVTDVDDKILRRALELKRPAKDISSEYEKEFWRDLSYLNVRPSTSTPRVTEHIAQIISFIDKIMENGHAYKVRDGSIYFDATSFKHYEKFVPRSDTDRQQSIFDPGKQNQRDFALWKATKPAESVAWDSPWGKGRPGWHIECSAMSCHLFGPKLDLHSGGMDLVFPHHENEEAQCCAHHGISQWCPYWIHSGHLVTRNSEKMSKSLKNTVSISDFVRSYSANLFRIICAFSHYRSCVEFSPELLSKSEGMLNKLNGFLQDASSYMDGRASWGPVDEQYVYKNLTETEAEIRRCLADDFDTESAMHSLLAFISSVHKQLQDSKPVGSGSRSISVIAAARNYVSTLLRHLGFIFEGQLLSVKRSVDDNENIASNIIESSVRFRRSIKKIALEKNKDVSEETKRLDKEKRVALLSACDRFRDELKQIGVSVKDYGDDSTWTFDAKKGKTEVNS